MKKATNPTGKGGFQKGVSGNISGKPKGWSEFRALCRDRSEGAIERLSEIVLNSRNEDMVIRAAEVLLAYGWGKPQAAENAAPEGAQKLETLKIEIVQPCG